MSMDRCQPSEIEKTMQRLQPVVNHTPVMTSRTFNERAGCDVFFKCENFQRVGAFKFRGAYHAISRLSPEAKRAGVVTHSSGNHAQGVALAAQLLDVKATIVMPDNSTPVKVAATAGYGAEIVQCPAADREQVSEALLAEHGYTMIHPYDNVDVILGQGTAAWELLEETGPLDYVFTPCGGGGLLSGTALAAAAAANACRVVGVEPEIADDANRSWRSGEIVTLPTVPNTIADGVRTRFVGTANLSVMRQYVHDMIVTSEAEILEALSFVWARLKLVIEPSAAVAVAPLLQGRYSGVGRVGVILSGGNVNVPGCGFFHQTY